MRDWLKDKFADQRDINAVKQDIMDMAVDDYVKNPTFDLDTVEHTMQGMPLSRLKAIREEWENRE